MKFGKKGCGIGWQEGRPWLLSGSKRERKVAWQR